MARVELRQFLIAPGSLDRYHMYLAFVDDSGQTITELHGHPYNRQTGDFAGAQELELVQSFVDSSNLHLKVIQPGDLNSIYTQSSTQQFANFTPYDLTTTVVNGNQVSISEAEMDALFDKALSLAESITNQNLGYSASQFDGWNSNAVVNSLITALGLSRPALFTVPEELTQNPGPPPFGTVDIGVNDFLLLAPGITSNIIPQGWEALSGRGFRLTGGTGADDLIGGIGSDELMGGEGDDVLKGRGGDDILDGGDGTDIADYSDEAQQPTTPDATKTLDGPDTDTITVIVSGGNVTVEDRWYVRDAQNNPIPNTPALDTLTSIEHIIAPDGTNDTIRFLNQELIEQLPSLEDDPEGSFRFDVNGTDILFEGFEKLEGDSQTDNTFKLRNLGLDVDGVGGENTIDYSNVEDGGGLTIDLQAGTVAGASQDSITNIQNAVGTKFDDNLIGSTGPNKLTGGDGNDTFTGGGGADLFLTGDGDVVKDADHDDLIRSDLYPNDGEERYALLGEGYIISESWLFRGNYGEEYWLGDQEDPGPNLEIRLPGEGTVIVENWIDAWPEGPTYTNSGITLFLEPRPAVGNFQDLILELNFAAALKLIDSTNDKPGGDIGGNNNNDDGGNDSGEGPGPVQPPGPPPPPPPDIDNVHRIHIDYDQIEDAAETAKQSLADEGIVAPTDVLEKYGLEEYLREHKDNGGWDRYAGPDGLANLIDDILDKWFDEHGDEEEGEPPLPDWLGDAADAFDDAHHIISPLVLDLDGDGVELVALEESSAFFDLDSDNFAERTGWVEPDDGLLAIDRDGDGRIGDISELFGNAMTDGFSELSDLDTNADGAIDIDDAQFANLLIWVDANRDGYSQESELQPLALKQFRLFTKDNKPVAFATWAFVSEGVESRLKVGQMKLKPAEWRSGDRCWIVDVVSLYAPSSAIVDNLKRSALQDHAVSTGL